MHKDDFMDLDTALRLFFLNIHQVRVAEVQPCPMGDAYVRLNSALEREMFLGPVFSFGPYQGFKSLAIASAISGYSCLRRI